MVPLKGFEPPTHALRMRCSTPELQRLEAFHYRFWGKNSTGFFGLKALFSGTNPAAAAILAGFFAAGRKKKPFSRPFLCTFAWYSGPCRDQKNGVPGDDDEYAENHDIDAGPAGLRTRLRRNGLGGGWP